MSTTQRQASSRGTTSVKQCPISFQWRVLYAARRAARGKWRVAPPVGLALHTKGPVPVGKVSRGPPHRRALKVVRQRQRDDRREDEPLSKLLEMITEAHQSLKMLRQRHVS